MYRAAMDEFGLEEGLIITDDIEREEEVGGRRIVFMPLWRWLLTTPSSSGRDAVIKSI